MNKTSIEAYRSAYKDYESICNGFSKRSGIGGAEYWILLLARQGIDTQSEICEQLFISKQTINSASRQLVKKGLIELSARESDLRAKRIRLTGEGGEFCEKFIDPLARAEERAWYLLSEEERAAFLELLRKINEYMKSQLNRCNVMQPSED